MGARVSVRGRTSHHRRDANHHELAGLAKQLGAHVVDTSQLGHGNPDLFVHYGRLGWFPVEIKAPGGKLRPKQQELQALVHVVNWQSREDVYRTLGFIA